MVVIAIDGPSGSGKSSVSKAVAREHNFAYLDTGAMYRAATLWAQQQCGSLDNPEAVAAAIRQMPLQVGLDPDNPRFYLDGKDVSEQIRESAVSAQVSTVATNLAVRDELRRRQRDIITSATKTSAGVVAEGRDITTVVAPDARVRVLLTASPEARLKRRSLEVHGSADDSAVAATRDEVLRRDADDSTVMEFQVAAPGVTTVDSSEMDFDHTVKAVLNVISGELKGPGSGTEGGPSPRPIRGPWTPPNEQGHPTGDDIPATPSIAADVESVDPSRNHGGAEMAAGPVSDSAANGETGAGLTGVGTTATDAEAADWERAAESVGGDGDKMVETDVEYAQEHQSAHPDDWSPADDVNHNFPGIRKHGPGAGKKGHHKDAAAPPAVADGAGAQVDLDPASVAADDTGDDEESREKALRAGLDEFELDEDDRAILADDWSIDAGTPEVPLPVLAVVGRPNVGKSTLVNRILGRREAVVEDKPGVTRDRVTYPAEWAGREFNLVDTGGWEVDVAGIESKVAEQAELAVELADAVIFVVDAMTGATATDERVVELLRRSGKPVVLAANKVDGASGEADAAYLWSLGLGEPHPISALHGRGVGDLLDAAMEALPTESAHGEVRPTGPRRVALVGRPNVGKSSLLNKLAGENRVVVDETAGTTRDPVDELIEIKGQPYWFVDTAGLRRRVHQTSGADFYASLRTAAAIEKAEVAVVLVDASEPLTEQDIRVIQQVVDAGRALVIAYNKWDLMDPDRRPYLEREIEQQLVQLQWAPRVNVSAKTGWHTDRLAKAIEGALESWDKRIPTGKLNAFLGELVAAHPHPVRGGKQPRILFATQASARPPRFVIFTTGFLEPSYRRFIERKLRETFGFEGTPIEISVRVREKRKR